MIVGLDFHQDVRIVLGIAIAAVRRRIKTPHSRAFDDRGIVGIGDDGSLGMLPVRVADHREQRQLLRLAVDYPFGIEDLVAAVLRIRLREHHQLDVGRIALQARKVLPQVVDLVVRKCEPHLAIGACQRRNATSKNVDRLERPRRVVMKQLRRGVWRIEHGLGHAVVNQRQQRGSFRPGEAAAAGFGHMPGDAAFDALDRSQAAMARNVGRFRGPRRNRAEARHHEQQLPRFRNYARRRAVAQDAIEYRVLDAAQLPAETDEMPEFGADA